MQYHKIIEQSEYDNDGNSVEKTRYEIIDGNQKLYIYGYDYYSPNNRNLDVLYSYDMNNYKPFLKYHANKNVGKYIYHCDRNSHKKFYDILRNIFNLQQENNQEQNQKQEQNNSMCIIL
jgi:hypothetical protein